MRRVFAMVCNVIGEFVVICPARTRGRLSLVYCKYVEIIMHEFCRVAPLIEWPLETHTIKVVLPSAREPLGPVLNIILTILYCVKHRSRSAGASRSHCPSMRVFKVIVTRLHVVCVCACFLCVYLGVSIIHVGIVHFSCS